MSAPNSGVPRETISQAVLLNFQREVFLPAQIYITPRIQPSTPAMVRSPGSSSGLKNLGKEPFLSARWSQAAAAYAAC